ncbi:cytosolic phospholipase A2 gamma-like [Pygocentrus nattereri]|uniref:PLA2c domain-containing protein n=1 Tax=Pygocentrus nattereri TaxID=42514 RepID=A0A3B4C2Z8_PYGNA|nr:cytosolic phospholipase A2 gamma-like [Pygocentrus nattereri]
MDQMNSESDVRIGHSLSEAERQHLAQRRKTVLQCLKHLGISCSEDKMPNIAVLGSGGGLRAMIGLLGSLCELKKDGLLDCIMYLCGVSGSTWCMASLYKELGWSTKLETVKENIVKRLADGRVSFLKRGLKLTKYYSEKDNFSLTDVWAALIVSHMVKEIDEHRLSEHRGNYTKDPYPIYTVIDKQCKYDKLNADPWFEITPDESGYSLTGAFVDSSYLGSQFENGKKMSDQPETDMLYLQGLCGSALADMEENLKYLYEALKHLITDKIGSKEESHEPQTPDVSSSSKVLLTLVELNLCVLRKEDPTVYLQAIKKLLKDGEAGQRTFSLVKRMTSEETISKTELKDLNLQVCSSVNQTFEAQRFGDQFWPAIVKAIEKATHWNWGTTYDYLYKMNVEDVHSSVLDSEKREYEDAGLLLNSPYFSVLRKERDIDLIISLDYSAGNPFETVLRAAKTCKELHIPFPEVVVPAEDREPQDFYVFRGHSKAPTVIHMPLFNAVNCKGEVQKWNNTYSTFQMSYCREMITALMKKAAENIKNNKHKLLKEIQNVIDGKKSSKLG